MKKQYASIKRGIYIVIILLMGVGIMTPSLFNGTANAGQVDNRNIKLSSSTNGANSVTYTVAYTAAATYTVRGIVVDFCSDSPLIAQDCTAPTGFNITHATPTSQSGISGFANASSTASTLKITSAAGSSMTGGVTNVAFSFVATNPTTTNTSFYTRMLAYTDDASGDSCVADVNNPECYVDTTPNGYSDYGGVALSTGNVITITTKVQESITFCVYENSGSCDNDPVSLSIGHGVNGDVIDNTAVDTDSTTSFNLATNAYHGAIVRIKGSLPTSGGNDIDAVNAGANTPLAMAIGTEAFGLYLTPGSGVSADANYGNTAGTFGWDTTSADNTTTTYGDVIATTAGPLAVDDTTLNFGAAASLTTPAGVYTTSVMLIATGTY